jgi:acid phosphatase
MMGLTRTVLAGLLATTLLGLGACSSNGSPAGPATLASQSSSDASGMSGTSAATAATAATAANPAVTKLLVLVVENHSLRQMRHGMPWTFRLAKRYGYADRYHAITHPSLPNYLAIAGGSTFGVRDDLPPASHRLRGASVFGQALRSGHTATVYAEGMPRRCALANGGKRYAVRHNPWTYFVDERAACRAHDVPFAALRGDVESGSLPNAGFVVPDLCHDAHDCPLRVADRWMKRTLRTVMSGPDWKSGHLAVVVTADEDDRRSGNRVLTVVAHPSVRGEVVHRRLTHYSLTRLYAQVLGTKPLRHGAGAPDMARAFGLPLPKG